VRVFANGSEQKGPLLRESADWSVGKNHDVTEVGRTRLVAPGVVGLRMIPADRQGDPQSVINWSHKNTFVKQLSIFCETNLQQKTELG
jgi:hypothetical protein